jgi:hypothetical protein
VNEKERKKKKKKTRKEECQESYERDELGERKIKMQGRMSRC